MLHKVKSVLKIALHGNTTTPHVPCNDLLRRENSICTGNSFLVSSLVAMWDAFLLAQGTPTQLGNCSREGYVGLLGRESSFVKEEDSTEGKDRCSDLMR